MSGNNFLRNLRRDNVDNDRKNILPNLGANRQTLNVAAIEKVIADVTDGNFEKLNTAEDVYDALQSLNGQDARLVFKTYVESLGIDCDKEALNKLNKLRIIALFFDVFAADSTPTVDEPPAQINTSEVPKYFYDIFPNFKSPVELNFAQVAAILPPQFRDVKSVDELQKNLREIEEGQIVRDFVVNAINAARLDCNFVELDAFRREDYLPCFFYAIHFTFTKISEPAPTPPPDEPKVLTDIINISFSHFDALYNVAKKISAVDLGFDNAGDLNIFEDNDVTAKDKFFFVIPNEFPILRGLVGIATLDGKIAAIGHFEDGIVDGEILPHAVFDWNRVHSEHFQNHKRFLAVLIPQDAENFFTQTMSKTLAESYAGKVYELEFTLNYKTLKVTDKPLCIDFGTSNTTAGTYDLEKGGVPELVTFRDVTKDEIVNREILPTIVYVESCRDGIVNYKYGYEAKKEIMTAGYDTKASVFYEIKRWANSLNEVEEVTDSEGNFAQVTRGEILRGYLMHVIKAAEQQYQVKFKNLHMTAPVKIKGKFIREMQQILQPYKIDAKGLDEGVAIVYHYLTEQIKNTRQNSGKILILDCGGGTTDLASCNYTIEKNPDSWDVIKIETDFENGDSNFGGNNITYRILQMLKMKIVANNQRNENLTMQELIPEDEDDILSQIDYAYENKERIYEKFNDEYARAEEIIPTKFGEYRLANEKRKIKRNFYYLWQMAEAIKIEFFKSNLVNVDFEEDKKIYVKSPEEYYLSIREGGKLQKLDKPMDGVEVTIREIVRIILPDLYALLKTLLSHYKYNELTQYKFRLSGQSCKINQFRDLFKEFVPGKLMRMPTKRGKLSNADSIFLKKYCIFGSIEYVRDAKAFGQHKPIIRYKPNRRIYDVNILVGDEEHTLLGHDGKINLRKFPKSTSVVKLLMRDENNRVTQIPPHHLDRTKAATPYYNLTDILNIMESETTHSITELKDSIGKAIQNIKLPPADDGKPGVMCIAALESSDGYGFNVYQIYIMPDETTGGVKYVMPNNRPFYSYEDEKLQTFFNGDK